MLLYYLSKIGLACFRCIRWLTNDKGQSPLAGYLVSDADDGGFGDSSVSGQVILDLAGSDLVSLHKMLSTNVLDGG